MRRALPFLTLLLLVGGDPTRSIKAADPPAYPQYDLTVRLDSATSLLDVRAVVTVAQADKPVEFLLNRALEITEASPPVDRVPLGDTAPFFGNNGTSGDLDAQRVARYRTSGVAPGGKVTLAYRGRFDFGLSAQKEEYTRGFRETVGIVGKDGVYLAGSSFWYPHFGPGLLRFGMDVQAPAGWHVISQGDGTSRDDKGLAHWRTSAPMDEIYVVGGPLRVWRDRAGAVETLVYLHDDDAAVANKYLAATGQYLEMYRALIGPYPYTKFALVENFWETGYGMPSFTLLGPSIIRFPFIITSSYPHEILHNWWGNSVFVDYESGNWCEGLTAYLADHLIQEQRGRGPDYRRSTLQKYASYVKAGRDFPLTEFRSRDSAATEAVGYGKTMMGFHMLRQRLGDDKFRVFLQRFYREYRGERATFRDVQQVAEKVAGAPLGQFFDDWITRPGAPTLAVEVTTPTREGDAYVVRGAVRQTSSAPPFSFDIPLVLQTDGPPVRGIARVAGAGGATFEMRSTTTPVALRVDPEFDVFRALDPREIPPSIGQIFGEPKIVAVLPSAAPAADQKAWRALVEGWRSDSHAIEIVADTAIATVPRDRAAWILGRENKLANLFMSEPNIKITADAISLDGERVPLADHSVVVVRRHPDSLDKAIGWISNSVPAAFEGLGRKLPHYGRYSYLGFEGTEPTNTVKGEWATTDSPLTVDLRPRQSRASRLPALTITPANALIELPPTFSEKTLLEHVAWLAAPEREGRGIGSAGLRQAADYIAAQFKTAGLAPAGDEGTWFQTVPIAKGPDGQPTSGVNVIGVLKGTKTNWDGQAVLVTAHYDHLGRGWPEAHAENAGKLHPGADDNASGVAVLLELARVFASTDRPQRSIVFVAFTGEEAGLVGSRYFVDHPRSVALDKIEGVINLDTVGRLGSGKISVLGAETATEWPPVFRGIGFVTGIESATVAGNETASDQRAFIERGVPAVQIFTGPHADYHRPGDTADKIDAAGLVKVATVAKEAVAYLAERPTPLTVTIAAATGNASTTAPAQPAPAAQGRRVSFGAVPDFTFQGTGVKLSDVTAGSPAAQAGLQAGDVIAKIDGTPTPSLQAFSDKLRSLQPGQKVTVTFVRGGTEQSLDVTVAAR